VPDDSAGRRCKCPACKSKFVIADPNANDMSTVAGYVIVAEKKPSRVNPVFFRENT
jgi:hypothetical protein